MLRKSYKIHMRDTETTSQSCHRFRTISALQKLHPQIGIAATSQNHYSSRVNGTLFLHDCVEVLECCWNMPVEDVSSLEPHPKHIAGTLPMLSRDVVGIVTGMWFWQQVLPGFLTQYSHEPVTPTKQSCVVFLSTQLALFRAYFVWKRKKHLNPVVTTVFKDARKGIRAQSAEFRAPQPLLTLFTLFTNLRKMIVNRP